MALDLSKLNFFKRLDARARIFVLIGIVAGVVMLIYFGTLYLSGSGATNTSSVAAAPQLQSVPGGELTPEFAKAYQQQNEQFAQSAQMSGGSAIPTAMKINQPGMGGSAASCIICSDDNANVKDDLNNWVAQGKITPEVSAALQALADKNVSVDEYAAMLDQLVREGKLTPEQARALLEKYKKQHQNALMQDSAKTMDAMIKSGSLPIDVANQLLEAQKLGASPADYAATLQNLVKDGKLSPAAAQQLLAQYTQQRAREIIDKSVNSLRLMAKAGQITPDVLKELIDLENRMVAVDAYNGVLQKNITAGKLTPAVAAKILDEFKSQKASIGPPGSIAQLLAAAEAAAYGELRDLLSEGKITQEVANQLADLIQKNIPLDDYQAVVNQLVQQKKLTPEIAKLKIADYQEVKGLREMAAKLGALQGNNASSNDYAEQLKKAVSAGIITPEQAAQLLQEYQAINQKSFATSALVAGPGNEDFARLQQSVQQSTPTETVTTDFGTAEAKSEEVVDQDRIARIEAIQNAMATQATQLITSWQPPAMQHKEGTPAKDKDKAGAGAAGTTSTSSLLTSTTTTAGADLAPLIKSGTIIFGVLDTAVNSDYPDSPVMVTIVEGKYKGAKLLGKLTTTKGVAGQMDRVSLNFTLMNMEDWLKSKTVTAYAIDPDTARTVLASSVDYHYMKRFGAMMATSFLQGYSTAITNAGTSTTGIFGTSTTHPDLDPSQKLAVALGQMGQTVGQATQNYVNIPPTVRVDSGVGLGILFMADVT